MLLGLSIFGGQQGILKRLLACLNNVLNLQAITFKLQKVRVIIVIVL
jgi:23S rRNA pseudoU1915 N3-methylase RlmH